jgi:hypothetical protein
LEKVFPVTFWLKSLGETVKNLGKAQGEQSIWLETLLMGKQMQLH